MALKDFRDWTLFWDKVSEEITKLFFDPIIYNHIKNSNNKFTFIQHFFARAFWANKAGTFKNLKEKAFMKS